MVRKGRTEKEEEKRREKNRREEKRRAGILLPFDDVGDILRTEALDGGVDLQVLLEGDAGPQRVDLRAVAHVLQRVIHRMEVCAVVSHQDLCRERTENMSTDRFDMHAKVQLMGTNGEVIPVV